MSADDQLRRLLWLIPAASREGGVHLDEAAEALGVSRRQVLKDVEALTERELFQPAGTAEGLHIELTERLCIHTTGQFFRPPRLTWRELACVAMGLRMREQDGEAATTLLARIETALGFPDPPHAPVGRAPDASGGDGARTGDEGSGPPPTALAELDRAWRLDEILAVLRDAWQRRLPCTIDYLKPGAPAPESRTLHCWALVQAEGRWYAVGRDPDAGDERLRNFRVDRVVSARLAVADAPPASHGDDEVAPAYRIPDDFSPADVLDGDRVLQLHGAPDQAVVEYSAPVTPWVRETWEGQETDNGAYRVRHAVGPSDWLIRHVLSYGEQARIVEPEELRQALYRTLRQMSEIAAP